MNRLDSQGLKLVQRDVFGIKRAFASAPGGVGGILQKEPDLAPQSKAAARAWGSLPGGTATARGHARHRAATARRRTPRALPEAAMKPPLVGKKASARELRRAPLRPGKGARGAPLRSPRRATSARRPGARSGISYQKNRLQRSVK